MPPHCDTLDGPVATAAKKALEAKDFIPCQNGLKKAGRHSKMWYSDR